MTGASLTGVAVMLAAAVALAPRTAGSQPAGVGGAADAQAEQLFTQGVAATERGDFAAGLRLFRESYRLNPLPDVLYNIGMCQKALGDLPASASAFRDYVAMVGTNMTADERAEFDGLLAELMPQIGRLVIDSTEAGAAVAIDGVQVGTTPLASWVAVLPGGHRVEVTKDRFAPFAEDVEVAAGQTLPVHAAQIGIDYAQPRVVEGPVTEPQTQAPLPTTPAESSGLSPWFWASVGVTAAAAVTMAVTGGLTLKYNDDFNAGGHRDADLRDTTLALRTTTDVFLGLAIAGAVAGTVLLLVGGADEEATGESSAQSVGVLPSGLVVVW